jgi:SAM-dependent methyltransferase
MSNPTILGTENTAILKNNFIKKIVRKFIGRNTEKYNYGIKRDNWIIQKLSEIPPNSRILDAGAGECRFKQYCSHLDYVSQDFAQYDGSGDSGAYQTGAWDQTQIDIVSDIVNIPEPDGSFDAIMCIEVFDHLPDPVLAVKVFSRLLRGGGGGS